MDQTSFTSFHPIYNLKGFVTSRPPLLVFLVCLLTFATTAISYAYFLRRSELKNPDVTLDWNGLLDNFAKLDFCINQNGTRLIPIDHDSNFPTSQEIDPPLIEASTLEMQNQVTDTGNRFDYDDNGNLTLSFYVTFKFGKELLSLPPNITAVTGVMCGRVLGLTGLYASREFRVTFNLPSDRQMLRCDWMEGCIPSQPICITFHGLPKIPVTRKMTTCHSVESLTDSTVTNLTSFSVPNCPTTNEWIFGSPETVPTCNGIVLHVIYKTNPDWSVMLSEHDRTLINLHLMYTSYFLFLMVMTLLCYAIIRGRPKTKIFMSEKMMLDS